MTNKEFVLETLKRSGRLAAESLQERAADMTGTELYAEEEYIPSFAAACRGEVKLESHYSSVYEEIRGLIQCTSCGKLKWFKGVDVYGLSGREKRRIKKCHAKAKRMAAEKWNAEVRS